MTQTMTQTMITILFIAHAPSDNTQLLRDAACAAIKGNSSVHLVCRSPFDCQLSDAMAADGIIFGTTENIGSMAGASKDFFDRTYNDLLDVTAGKPCAVYIRAGLDGTGTLRQMTSILGGLRWRLVAPILTLKGSWRDDFPEQSAELALTLAAGVEMGLY